jgi:hypothetical protein
MALPMIEFYGRSGVRLAKKRKRDGEDRRRGDL